MTRSTDQRRARQSLEVVYSVQNSLEQRLGQGASESLEKVLGDVWRRRSLQGERLNSWLRGEESAQQSASASLLADDPQKRESARVNQASTSEPGQVQVLERRELTPDLLIFKLARPPGFSFVPGASVKIELNGVSRRYSLVSAPHEPFLEFFIELIPNGRMSAKWRDVSQGDSVALQSPKAGLVPNPNARNHFLIATVTGVNPFVSMVREAVHKGETQQRFVLLHGASFASELGYSSELASIAAAHPQLLTYVPAVSRPDEIENSDWMGSQGRVGTHVEALLGEMGWTSRDSCIYACGNPDMVDDIEQTWRAQGFEVRTERYK